MILNIFISAYCGYCWLCLHNVIHVNTLHNAFLVSNITDWKLCIVLTIWSWLLCSVTPLSGFHGALAGFLVGLKQLLPNLELPMCFFWKIKAKVCWWTTIKYNFWACSVLINTSSTTSYIASLLFPLLLQWMPFFVLCFSTIMAFIVPDSINFLPTLLSGMYVSWIYLRYFQRNPLTGLKGDSSDDFSFPSLFPDAMR